MPEISREEAIKILECRVGEEYTVKEIDQALDKAVSDMEKLETIEEIISKQDELILGIYGVCIPEGYADLFEMIEQIVKGENK